MLPLCDRRRGEGQCSRTESSEPEMPPSRQACRQDGTRRERERNDVQDVDPQNVPPSALDPIHPAEDVLGEPKHIGHAQQNESPGHRLPAPLPGRRAALPPPCIDQHLGEACQEEEQGSRKSSHGVEEGAQRSLRGGDEPGVSGVRLDHEQDGQAALPIDPELPWWGESRRGGKAAHLSR